MKILRLNPNYYKLEVKYQTIKLYYDIYIYYNL